MRPSKPGPQKATRTPPGSFPLTQEQIISIYGGLFHQSTFQREIFKHLAVACLMLLVLNVNVLYWGEGQLAGLAVIGGVSLMFMLIAHQARRNDYLGAVTRARHAGEIIPEECRGNKKLK